MAHKVRSPYIYVESKNDGYTIYMYDAITAQNHAQKCHKMVQRKISKHSFS